MRARDIRCSTVVDTGTRRLVYTMRHYSIQCSSPPDAERSEVALSASSNKLHVCKESSALAKRAGDCLDSEGGPREARRGSHVSLRGVLSRHLRRV